MVFILYHKISKMILFEFVFILYFIKLSVGNDFQYILFQPKSMPLGIRACCGGKKVKNYIFVQPRFYGLTYLANWCSI